jgi:hypothetical protein
MAKYTDAYKYYQLAIQYSRVEERGAALVGLLRVKQELADWGNWTLLMNQVRM